MEAGIRSAGTGQSWPPRTATIWFRLSQPLHRFIEVAGNGGAARRGHRQPRRCRVSSALMDGRPSTRGDTVLMLGMADAEAQAVEAAWPTCAKRSRRPFPLSHRRRRLELATPGGRSRSSYQHCRARSSSGSAALTASLLRFVTCGQQPQRFAGDDDLRRLRGSFDSMPKYAAPGERIDQPEPGIVPGPACSAPVTEADHEAKSAMVPATAAYFSRPLWAASFLSSFRVAGRLRPRPERRRFLPARQHDGDVVPLPSFSSGISTPTGSLTSGGGDVADAKTGKSTSMNRQVLRQAQTSTPLSSCMMITPEVLPATGCSWFGKCSRNAQADGLVSARAGSRVVDLRLERMALRHAAGPSARRRRGRDGSPKNDSFCEASQTASCSIWMLTGESLPPNDGRHLPHDAGGGFTFSLVLRADRNLV